MSKPVVENIRSMAIIDSISQAQKVQLPALNKGRTAKIESEIEPHVEQRTFNRNGLVAEWLRR